MPKSFPVELIDQLARRLVRVDHLLFISRGDGQSAIRRISESMVACMSSTDDYDVRSGKVNVKRLGGEDVNQTVPLKVIVDYALTRGSAEIGASIDATYRVYTGVSSSPQVIDGKEVKQSDTTAEFRRLEKQWFDTGKILDRSEQLDLFSADGGLGL